MVKIPRPPARRVAPDSKKIAQESPKASQAIRNLRIYGMGRGDILALVQEAMNVADNL